jgi:hypothetical protein
MPRPLCLLALWLAAPFVSLRAQVIITEFMAVNQSTRADADGDFEDWIEIHNPTAAPVDLTGWGLTDNASQPFKWTFPSVTLPARGYRLIYASDKDRRDPAGEWHTNFRLSAGGEALVLTRPDLVQASAFLPAYPTQLPDRSYGYAATNLVTVLLDAGATGRVQVPTDGSLGAAWTAAEFDDSGWSPAATGIGFETGASELGPGAVGDLLDRGPSGYWRLDEPGLAGLLATNAVAGGQAGQYLGGVIQNVEGPRPSAFPGFPADHPGARFDGVNDKVEIPFRAAHNAGSFSFSLWMKLAGGGGFRAALSSRDDAPQRGYILYVDNTGLISFWSGTGSAWHSVTGPAAVIGAWTHVAGTYEAATQTKRLFVNGEPVGQATGVSFSPNTVRLLRIGAGRNESAPGDYWWNGDLDEVAVWDRALTDTEIGDQFRAATLGPDAPGVLLAQAPAAYWRLQDSTVPTSLTAANAGRTGVAGTLSGGVTGGLPGVQPPSQAGYPVDNTAFRFDGTTGKVDVPHHAEHNPPFFTVELWARCVGGAGTYRSPLTSRDDNPQRGFVFYAANNNRWEFWSGTGAQVGWHILSGPSVTLNAWTHLVGTYDGAVKRFYVNGVPAGEAPTVIAPNLTRPLRIGAGATEGAGGLWFPGDVDEVAVIPRVLSPAEVAQRYERAALGAPRTDFAGRIATDLQAAMFQQNASAYLRLPFTVADPDAMSDLELRLQYDDGFQVWLNGAPVASAHVPESLAWNSSAVERNLNADAVAFESFSLDGYFDALVPGTNVLAFQALNLHPDNPDLLLLPRLEAGQTVFLDEEPVYLAQPTPGEANGPGSVNPGPLLADPAHLPDPLPETEPLALSVRASPLLGSVTNVTAHWRVNFGPETAAEMFDDGLHGDGGAGDGVYGVTLPASAYGPAQMVRWRFTAVDAEGRTSRFPAFAEPTNSPEYLGTMTLDTTGFASQLPVWYWFADSPAAADTRAGTRGAVFFQGQLYDNVFIRQRGAATSSGSRKFDFNTGHHAFIDARVGRVEEANLNGSAIDPTFIRPPLAFEVFRTSGHAAGHAFPLIQRANGGTDRLAYFVEQVDERLLSRVGLDRQGALYKMNQRPDLEPCLHDTTGGVQKRTRLDEDRSDLQVLVDTVKNLSDSALRSRRLHDQLNLANAVNYLACRVVVNEFDDVRKNFYLYRDTRNSGEWFVLPWDKDGTFGIVGDSGPNLPHPFWGDQAHRKANADQWCYLWEALHNDPRTRVMYLRRLRSVMDQQLQASPGYLEDRAAAWFAGLAPHLPAQNIDAILNWLPTRRQQLYLTYTAPDSVAPGFNIPAAQDPGVLIQFGAVEVNPPGGNQEEEYIQLVNTNAVAVDISHWQVDGGVRHTFPAGTVILPGDALYLARRAAAFRARATSPTGGETLFVQGDYSGALSARGETLHLLDPRDPSDPADDRLVHSLTYPADATPAQLALRVTELHYNPAPGGAFDAQEYEYLELMNISAAPLDLTGATFNEGITFTFGPHLLPAGGRVVLVKNAVAHAARFPDAPAPLGEYQGNLSNSGERLRLVDAAGEEVLDFTWFDIWHPPSDGGGYALVVADPSGTPPEQWGDPAAWALGSVLGGTPGAAEPYHAVPERPGRLSGGRAGAGVDLVFLGAAGRAYTIERSTNQVGWAEVAAPVADGNGRLEWTDPAPPAPRAYYRVREP